VLAFCLLVPAVLVTLQVADGSEGPGVPTLAVPVTLAVALFFLALLGGGPGSIDERMHYQRALPGESPGTTAGLGGFFRWSAADTVAIVLGLLILVIFMYFLWGRPKQRESSDSGVRADFNRAIALYSNQTVSAFWDRGQAQRRQGIVAEVSATGGNMENNRCH
jgi:uncharacterized membrane protein YfcA